MDEPTRFMFRGRAYEPANFGDSYYGPVTVRRAMRQSLNVPTVKVAEMIGYDNIVRLAMDAGITQPLQGTPSLALGSYEVPPIELAEAYTIFANGGAHVKRRSIDLIRDLNSRTVFSSKPEATEVLDPRVAYIATNMMEDVVRAGTASAVRAKGFGEPAAGKTGTAHDGWFAGYTNNLLTVVWIGYDDYTELGLEGSKSALPVWTEFMKRAHKLKQYAKPGPFKAPSGIVRVEIDDDTGLLPGDACLRVRTEMFVAGTEPTSRCEDPHDLLYTDEGIMTETDYREKKSRGVFGKVLDVFRR
jgi:penicillin-binding protein 1B